MVAHTAIKPGDVLYDCRRVKMGNTTISVTRCWKVEILEVHEEPRWHVIASWNGNAPKRMSQREMSGLRRSPPKDAR